MIPLLGPGDDFPPIEMALDEPNGLLAAGGGLGVERLRRAYARGIFPWFSPGDPVLWWCPDPRVVLPTDAVHLSRSLRRRLRRDDYDATFDRAFPEVLRRCAAPRRSERGTWLVPSMRRAYERLHDIDAAHSIEIWMDGELAGGLYGVVIGRMFFGESMFSAQPDGSKIALAVLAAQLARWGFPMIDCQLPTPHLRSMGAVDVSRRTFVQRVHRLVNSPPVSGPWQLDADIIPRFRRSAAAEQ
jgi:leucyl/phenylalanyl-tRNA--protein transferase